MKKITFFLFTTFISIISIGQEITGAQLLDKAIAYHDPLNNWSSFNGKLFVIMETPNKSKLYTEIIINLPEEYFYSKAIRDSIIIEFTVDKEQCEIKYNGKKDYSEETATEHRLSCERAHMYKNYYTYLYGLPMKLRDPGTNIHEIVELRKFKGKEYLVLKVTYDEGVGDDAWYFYFNPENYAMEVYQFFHNEYENDGEYILLSGEEIINNIKIPKARAWYMNKDNRYLGTDLLNSN